MDCYAGKMRAEANPHEPDIFDEPGVYLQFVEGCGYTVFTLTPEEAEQYADMLKASAKASREAFQKKTKASRSRKASAK